MLPDIAGYVGADTCGCILTLRQDQQNEISLMDRYWNERGDGPWK